MAAPINIDALMRETFIRLMAREGFHRPHPAPDPTLPDSRFLDLKRLEALARRHHRRFGREVWVRRDGWRGWIEAAYKRLLHRLLFWHAWPQIEYNEILARSVTECLRQFDALADEIIALRQIVRNYSAARFHGA